MLSCHVCAVVRDANPCTLVPVNAQVCTCACVRVFFHARTLSETQTEVGESDFPDVFMLNLWCNGSNL